jgi:hypothetical protein
MTITREQVEMAIETCIRRACGRPSDEWYAITLWPDGHFEQRCGIGDVTYGEDEYFNRPHAERTIYSVEGIPDIDLESEWIDPDTGEVDEEAAIQDFIDRELLECFDGDGIAATVRAFGHEYEADRE